MQAPETAGIRRPAGQQSLHKAGPVLHRIGLAIGIDEPDFIGRAAAHGGILRASRSLIAFSGLIDIGKIVRETFGIHGVPLVLIKKPFPGEAVIGGVGELMDHCIGAQIVVEIKGKLHCPVRFGGESAGVGDIARDIQRMQRPGQIKCYVPVITAFKLREIGIGIKREHVFKDRQRAVYDCGICAGFRDVIGKLRRYIGTDQDTDPVSFLQLSCLIGESAVIGSFRSGVSGS